MASLFKNVYCNMCSAQKYPVHYVFFSEFRKDVFSVSVAGLGFQQQ